MLFTQMAAGRSLAAVASPRGIYLILGDIQAVPDRIPQALEPSQGGVLNDRFGKVAHQHTKKE
jgi:hypothetical protein